MSITKVVFLDEKGNEIPWGDTTREIPNINRIDPTRMTPDEERRAKAY